MSTASRLVSGSAASWARIGTTLMAQLALVPIYLSYWSVEVYGVWIALYALVDMLSTVDVGHQNFVGFEFLRLGKEDRRVLSRYLCSGAGVALGLGLLQVLAIALLFTTGAVGSMLDETVDLSETVIHEAGIVLLLLSTSWMICGSLGGLLGRLLAVFGYYPRTSWWQVWGGLVKLIAPTIAVVLGAGLLTTGIVAASTNVLFHIPFFADMIRLLKKENITYQFSWTLGLKNFSLSLALSAKGLLESARQQGVRLVLAPLAGATQMVAFATMRTGANAALQGLNTVANPLMPELMRFLHQRDQSRSEAAFGTVWIVVVAIMAPSVVVLQLVIEPLYTLWTKGKMAFDPWLFAILSLSVLVYAVAQPAIAVVRGNNLLKPQLVLSGIASIIVVGGMFVLVPRIGIVGAGIALLTAEIVAAVGYRKAAQQWLQAHHLAWPRRAATIATTSVVVAAGAMVAMVLIPSLKWWTLMVSLLMLCWNLYRYWQVLPTSAIQGAMRIVGRIPVVKTFFAT